MGYHVYITRKDSWTDEDGPQISEGEWQAYVDTDPDMAITGLAEITNPKGETIRLRDPMLTEWRRHSSGRIVWISYFEGNLYIKNPDKECLAKMREIAKHLHARVQGEEGEYYDEPSQKQSFFSRLFRRRT